MKQYTTYILYSKSMDAYYIGFTGEEISARLRKHLSAHKGFTSKAKDWTIAHFELYRTKSEAMQREKQLKNWKSKVRIEEFISKRSTE
jgi:putative endonuclease